MVAQEEKQGRGYMICIPTKQRCGNHIFEFEGEFYMVNLFHVDLEAVMSMASEKDKIAYVDWTDKKKPIFIKWMQ